MLLDDLLSVSKETQLNTEDLRRLLFSVWHNAAARDYLGTLERTWMWAEEVQRNPHGLKMYCYWTNIGRDKLPGMWQYLQTTLGAVEIEELC